MSKKPTDEQVVIAATEAFIKVLPKPLHPNLLISALATIAVVSADEDVFTAQRLLMAAIMALAENGDNHVRH